MDTYKKKLSEDILKAITNFGKITGVEVFNIEFERVAISTLEYPYDTILIHKIDFTLK